MNQKGIAEKPLEGTEEKPGDRQNSAKSAPFGPDKEVPVTETGPKNPDPFDPTRLRLTQGFGSTLGTKKALLTVPVRKPAKEWWVRAHPDVAYRVETLTLELKEDREIFLVDPSLWNELSPETTICPKAIFTAINRQGVLFLWPIRLPGPDGRQDEWSRSALEGAAMAMKGWVRITANMSLGAYEVTTTKVDIPDPVWPEIKLQEILRIAFKDKYIDDINHKVLKALRGEA